MLDHPSRVALYICMHSSCVAYYADWPKYRIHNRYTKRVIRSTRPTRCPDASSVEHVWFHLLFGLLPPPPELYHVSYTRRRPCVLCARQRVLSRPRRELRTLTQHHRHTTVQPICHRATTLRAISRHRTQPTRHRITTIRQQLHGSMLAPFPRWGSPHHRFV